MKQFDVPAVVEADPDANATDLLLDAGRGHARRAPSSPFPDGDGGWSDVTAAEFLAQVRRPRQGPRRRRHRARRQDRPDVPRPATSGRSSTSPTWFAGAVLVPDLRDRRRPARCSGTSATRSAVAVIVETADHFARFDEMHADLPPSTQRLADRPRRPRQARRLGHRRSPTRRSSAAATSRWAPTSRPSSTPRAPTGGPRAASSPTRTSSS